MSLTEKMDIEIKPLPHSLDSDRDTPPPDLAGIHPKPARAATPSARSRRKPSARQFWMKQLHAWHWVSAALSLCGMFLFSITGITLNHSATIGAKPIIVTASANLPASSLGLLQRASAKKGESQQGKPLPPAVANDVAALVDVNVAGARAEWSETEVYVAVPGPGSDAWASIDLDTGAIEAERTDRGWISFFNDLHKGRNTGGAWFWLIDALAVACVIFTLTGMFLLQLHARHRPSTWPLVALGTAIPLIIVVLFMHA